jgi:hypothetical protein
LISTLRLSLVNAYWVGSKAMTCPAGPQSRARNSVCAPTFAPISTTVEPGVTIRVYALTVEGSNAPSR